MSSAPKVPEVNWRVPAWFPDLSADQQAKLKSYFGELIRVNKTTNLIPPKTVLAADQVHFADSILGSRLVMKEHPQIKKIWDLGSGNGFPGLVFAILYPAVEVNLVDADQRKIEFLKHCIAHLKLTNVVVHSKQVETLGADSIEYALCRGFSELAKTMMMLRTLVKVEGIVFNFKSDVWGLELSRVPAQLCSIWNTTLVGNYVLPDTNMSFAVVRTTRAKV